MLKEGKKTEKGFITVFILFLLLLLLVSNHICRLLRRRCSVSLNPQM